VIYIGLDLSLTASGMVSISDAGAVIESKTFGYGLKRDSSGERKIKRLLHISNEVCSFIKSTIASGSEVTVVIEGYAYGARGSQNDLAELQGAIKTQIYLMFSLVPVIVPATKARKVVLGQGRVSKDEIIEGLKGLGYDFTDHNQADAFVVARSVMLEGQEL
jgi:Holliday junction resolvasome RuvABC endonuclease subunit